MFTMTNGGNYAPTTPEQSVALVGRSKHKQKFRARRGLSTVKIYDYGMMRSVRRTVACRTVVRK